MVAKVVMEQTNHCVGSLAGIEYLINEVVHLPGYCFGYAMFWVKSKERCLQVSTVRWKSENSGGGLNMPFMVNRSLTHSLLLCNNCISIH